MTTDNTKAAEEDAKKRAELAKKYIESSMTDAEKYQQKMNEIALLLNKGDLTAAQAQKALGQLKEEISGGESKEAGSTKFAGALDAGSAEGRSAILQAITGRANKDDKVEKNTADMAATLKRIEELQRLANGATSNQSGGSQELAMY